MEKRASCSSCRPIDQSVSQPKVLQKKRTYRRPSQQMTKSLLRQHKETPPMTKITEAVDPGGARRTFPATYRHRRHREACGYCGSNARRHFDLLQICGRG